MAPSKYTGLRVVCCLGVLACAILLVMTAPMYIPALNSPANILFGVGTAFVVIYLWEKILKYEETRT